MAYPRMLGEFWGRAPGWLVLVLTMVAVGSSLAAYSCPTPSEFERRLGGTAWVCAGILIAVRVVIRLVVPARLFQKPAPTRVFHRRVGMFVVALLTVCALIAIRAPLVARFWISLPALNRAVARAQERPGATRGNEEWIGAFPVIAVFQPGGTVAFVLDGGEDIVYAPGGGPVIYRGAGGYVFELELTRIWADWYSAKWRPLP